MKRAERKAKRGLIQAIRLFSPKLKSTVRFQGDLNRILVFAQEKMGDAILLTPLLALLKRHAPHANIDIAAMSPMNSPVFAYFENDPNIHQVYHVKKHYFKFIRQAKIQHYDVLINTKDHPSFNFLLLTSLIPARYKVGITHDFHQGFFHWMLESDFHQHIVDKYGALVDFFGILDKQTCRPYIPKGPVTSEVQMCVDQINPPFLIGINLSAGHAKREWPLETWRELLKTVRDPIIIFSMPDRNHEKIQLEKEFPHVLSTPATRSIFDVATLMRKLNLLVTPDTSLIHVASCLGTPVVGLYTSEIIHLNRFGPYKVPFETVVSSTQKVADIPVHTVVRAVNQLKKKLS